MTTRSAFAIWLAYEQRWETGPTGERRVFRTFDLASAALDVLGYVNSTDASRPDTAYVAQIRLAAFNTPQPEVRAP